MIFKNFLTFTIHTYLLGPIQDAHLYSLRSLADARGGLSACHKRAQILSKWAPDALTDGSTRRQSPAPLAGGPAATLTRQQQHTLPSARSISRVRTCVHVRPTPQSHMQREGANHNQIICEAGINAHAKRSLPHQRDVYGNYSNETIYCQYTDNGQRRVSRGIMRLLIVRHSMTTYNSQKSAKWQWVQPYKAVKIGFVPQQRSYIIELFAQ